MNETEHERVSYALEEAGLQGALDALDKVRRRIPLGTPEATELDQIKQDYLDEFTENREQHRLRQEFLEQLARHPEAWT